MLHIVKRIFTTDDIVDLKIDLYGHIEDINIHCVSVNAVYYYHEWKPRSAIAGLTGLMLVETVLFDSEKFLQDNTRRTPKE